MAVSGAVLAAALIGTMAPVQGQQDAPAVRTEASADADTARLRAQIEALATATPDASQSLFEKAASSVRSRLAAAEAVLRRVGLDPHRFGETAVGGPYIPATADQRVRTLALSWQQASAMEAAIASIPSYVPVKSYVFTSPFGVRYDPFNGHTAMHAGLDMSGQQGEAIYAAADGVVVTGGRSGAYGNLVEIDHGRGLATRYGHLSAILVHPGEQVHQGELIARMGSTGRSTGTHLHYEIRLDGRAINPRPFLDASGFMLAAQGRGMSGPRLDGLSLADLTPDDTVSYTLVTRGAMPTLVRN